MIIKIVYRCLIALFAVLAVSCADVKARNNVSSGSDVMTVEGQAAIVNNMPLLARNQALADAIRQASLTSGVSVRSETFVDQNNVTKDTYSMHSAASVRNARIIKEWSDGDIYHVVARVNLSSDSSCSPHYRKRIVATAFPMAKQEQLTGFETQDLYSGVPRELANQLMESGEFVGINATQINLYSYSGPDLAPALPRNNSHRFSELMKLATSKGAQFVLSGVIRDFEVESTDYMSGAGPLAFVRSLAREVVARRGIGIDVYVYDGFTGALLFQQRYVDDVIGDVWIPSSYTVGSERFNATSSGGKIADIIEKASQDIRKALECFPFATRIIDIKDNNKIYIDAGAQEGVNVGDRLVVYSTKSDNLLLDGGASFIGKDKQPVAVLTIENITARYAIGSLEATPRELGVRVGDWVRSW